MTAHETMLRLMSLPRHFVGVTRTSDGFYIAQVEGDVGYNAFLGKPQPVHAGPGLDNALRIWAGLSDEERKAVHAVAASPMDGSPIPLTDDFGIPEC